MSNRRRTRHATSEAERDTRLDLREEGTVVRPMVPHEPAPALLEIRLPSDVASPRDEMLRCPRCNTPLSERCDLGWCQRCGYCRYMEKRKVVPASVVHAQLEAWRGPRGIACCRRGSACSSAA